MFKVKINKLWLILILTVVSLIIVISSSFLSYQIHKTNKILNKEISILVKILSDSGYGGFIHNYKSYLLLNDEKYFKKANAQLEKLIVLLNQVIDLEKEKSKKDNLKKIKNTFTQYKNNLEQIKKLKQSGVTDINSYYHENSFHDAQTLELIELLIKDLLVLVQKNEDLSSTYSFAFLLTIFFILVILVFFTRSWLQKELLIKQEVINKTAELENSKKFLELVIENNPDCIFVKDDFFRITMANRNFLLMYPEDQRKNIIGKTTLEQYKEEEAEQFLEMDKKAFHEGKSETVEKIQFPDGITRTLLTKKIRFTNNENKAFILGIAKDITERENFIKTLEQVNDELEQFAYRISHDIKSPLVTIKGLVRYVIQDVNENNHVEALKNLDVIKKQCEQLNELTSDILDLSKADHINDEFQSIDLHLLVKNIISKYQFHIERQEILIRNHIPENKLLTMQRTRLSQILDNLISNAIKYIDKNKQEHIININAETNDSNCILTISDNGLGIPENKHNEVFSMFKRFHADNISGSGLGLAIVKKHIEKVGGAIEFTSSDKGTVFTVILPKINKNYTE